MDLYGYYHWILNFSLGMHLRSKLVFAELIISVRIKIGSSARDLSVIEIVGSLRVLAFGG